MTEKGVMGFYINMGNEGFCRSRNSEYVDKSGLIAFVNSKIDTDQNMICVTRARRFGKTMAAKMLYAYYDKSCDSRPLFEDLEIASSKPVNPEDPDGPRFCDSFERHLNRYPSIFVDMTGFVARKSLYGDEMVVQVEKELREDLAAAYPDVAIEENTPLPRAFTRIYKATGERFIFIMDEWDAPLREYSGHAEMTESWVGFLRSMFKDASVLPAFAGVYLTGIFPIIKYNTQSALNNFKEYNLISPEPIGRYLGFTEDEVKALCQKYRMDYPEMQSWYDGYQAGDLASVFNPNSVMTALEHRKCRSYWTATGAGDELVPYLRHELREDVQKLVGGEAIRVKTDSFDNKIDDIGTRDKLFTALIHLGYLSYDGNKARIPNLELLLYFGACIQDADLGGLTKVLNRSEDLIEYIYDGEADKVGELMGLCHSDICGAQEYNSEQALYTTLREALFFAHRDYIFHREYPTGKGFADLVLIPKPGRNIPAIVVELKYDRGTASPISQIRERNYPQKVAEYTGSLLLVGINYDPATKVHQCTISRPSLPHPPF